MRRSTVVFALIVGTILVGMVVSVGLLAVLSLQGDDEGDLGSLSFGDRVAVVEVTGVILDSRPVIEALHRHRDNRSVRAIVLRLDTPGGAVAPSQEIYEEVKKLRDETKKPVVASMGSVAASGGYYVASAADEIVANPGTVTGSIGVIMRWTNYAELMKWAKLKPEVIASGPFKAAGDRARELSEEERSYFQNIIDDLRDQFVEDVADGRKGKLSLEEVDALADGRIFTGREAVEAKLVDELGDLHDAVDRAAKLAKISGKPTLVYPRPKPGGFFDLLSEGMFGGSLRGAALSGPSGGYRFFYLW